MIEITFGACPACFGTVPCFSLMGQRHQLFPYQFECLAESSGSCTRLYIVSNSSITLISEWTQQTKNLTWSCKETVCGHINFALLETLEGFPLSPRDYQLAYLYVLYLGQ
jgi:hypothetical protein